MRALHLGQCASVAAWVCLVGLAQAQELGHTNSHLDSEPEAEPEAEPEPEGGRQPSTVRPASPYDVAGKGFLAMEGLLFSSSKATFDTQDAFGQPQKIRYSRTSLGLASPSWGIAGGYAFSNYFVLGMRTTLEHAQTEVSGTQTGFPTTKNDYTAVSLAPFLKVMMTKGSVVVPYATGTIGYKKVTSDVSSDTDGVSFGAGLGLSIFPNPFFSIEPAASLILDTVQTNSGGQDTSSTSTGVYLTLALSGWLGGRRHAVDRSDYSEQLADYSDGQPEAAANAELTLSLKDEGNVLEISVNSSDRQPQFAVKLTTTSGEDSGECQSLTIASDKQTATLPARSSKGDERDVTTQVPYKAMQAGVTEARSAWTTCGTTWELSGADRRELLDFLNQFREQANQQETLESARRAPMPEGGKLSDIDEVATQPTAETPTDDTQPESEK